MSKGLDDFKWLVENGYISLHYWQEDVVMLECVNNIEQELKALEIIKEYADVRVLGVKDEYYLLVGDDFRYAKRISKEKYDLLKEVLL